jgi:hypothetical protein
LQPASAGFLFGLLFDLKMGAICSSETLVDIHPRIQNSLCYNLSHRLHPQHFAIVTGDWKKLLYTADAMWDSKFLRKVYGPIPGEGVGRTRTKN